MLKFKNFFNLIFLQFTINGHNFNILQINILSMNYQDIQMKKKWKKQLDSAMSEDYGAEKYYRILNYEEALDNFVAFIELNGPPRSPYEGYSFFMEFTRKDYMRPPQIKFVQIPWSPFVCQITGKICCDILQEQWCPALFLKHYLISITSLLSQTKPPENEPGLNLDASAEMKTNYALFFEHAKKESQEKGHKNQNLYKQEEKPPAEFPEDSGKQKQQIESEKQAFLNDPQIQEKYDKKLDQILKQ